MLQIVYDQRVISLLIHLINYLSTNMIFYKNILSQIIQVQMGSFWKNTLSQNWLSSKWIILEKYAPTKLTKSKVNFFDKIHSHKIA